MQKQGKGKRKAKEYKENLKKIKSNDNESDDEGDNENKEKNSEEKQQNNSKKNIKNKNKINKKIKGRKKEENKTINKAPKVFYDYVNKIKGKEQKNIKNNKNKEEIKENNEIDDDKNNNEINIHEETKEDENDNENKEDENESENEDNNIDDIFLSTLYDLFNEYDEIIIKRDKNKQYIINANIKIEDEKEIRFEIVYDNERPYFDYYPDNKNFVFEKEDEPFNYDLDIPKEDFCLLIRNFKKFKKK